MTQLALPIQLADHAVFGTFLSAGNEAVVAHLRELEKTSDGQGCWVWGAAATGKTHLLQAVCEAAGDRAAYLPLRLLADAGPEVLDGLASRELVCIDDLGVVVGKADWEQSLFRLCNDMTEFRRHLIVSAECTPRESGVRLADLASRLSRLPAFHLNALDELDRVRALQLRARHRGIDLPDDTAGYMIRHSRRDMASLYGLLDRLDIESLKAQRRLTVPFVRGILKESPAGGIDSQ